MLVLLLLRQTSVWPGTTPPLLRLPCAQVGPAERLAVSDKLSVEQKLSICSAVWPQLQEQCRSPLKELRTLCAVADVKQGVRGCRMA